MYITIDEDDGRPVYRQVADEIKALIASRELRDGAALPPVRQVAADLGVNLNTIAAAYRALQKEGLLLVRHGAGAVVTSAGRAPRKDSDIRKPLRSALAHMVLSGLSRAEILAAVDEEIRQLHKNHG
ncbi:MAG: GntR family transcriptional regulator [Pyrinomonadaceae bacterium]